MGKTIQKATKVFRRRISEAPEDRLDGHLSDERMVELYRKLSGEMHLQLPAAPRASFAQWLELQVRHTAQGRQPSFRRWLAGLRLSSPLPALSFGVALGLILGVLGAVGWRRQERPRITSNALLVRAEGSYTAAGTAGVVHQTVRIRARQQTLERSLYWDLAGKRRPRRSALTGQEEALRSALSGAGVDWDRPVSAASYQAWHDQQHERSDRITKLRGHLLLLTTSVPEGTVAEESLTVRDTDFHPVRRTVGFRDRDTVEIAELNFQVLPWNAVEAGAFEPIGGLAKPLVSATPGPRPALPSLPLELASADQLDETELTARLVLSQFHADTGEQIELHRSPREVVVEGLVESDARKRELQAQLQGIRNLKVEIQSVADLSKQPMPAVQAIEISAAPLPDQPSPLESTLKARGESVDTISTLAQQLFMNALAISQESRAIADLQSRFTAERQMSVIASATLADLMYSHHERLGEALGDERALLAKIGGASSPSRDAGVPQASLLELAARNLALASELTQTNAPARRPAEAIAGDMTAATGSLAAAARRSYENPQGNTAQKEKE